ncbi:MAG: septum formation initiator family protein [Gemmatimonadaceae bacterium]|nr:septum formation initiator family protein [Gemmatimonadaceae bacterium]
MRRLVVGLAIVLVVLFAVQGGEYSTTALFRLRASEHALRTAIDSLQQDVDSLTRFRRRIATDPALQERIAREENGMVRSDKELVYRFVPAEQEGGKELD